MSFLEVKPSSRSTSKFPIFLFAGVLTAGNRIGASDRLLVREDVGLRLVRAAIEQLLEGVLAELESVAVLEFGDADLASVEE